MNKKMMALFMSALMVVAAICIVVASPTDAGEGEGTSDNPNYIIGKEGKPVIAYVGDDLVGSIEFNKSAFTDNAEITFTNPDSTINYKEEGNEIKIAAVDQSTVYRVTVDTTAVSEINKKIKLTVKEKIPTLGNEFPEVVYYYAVNVIVRNSNDIKLTEDPKELDKVNEYTYGYKFKHEVDVHIQAGLVKIEDDVAYKFYAIGLPSGISMRVDGGVIGGKISKSLGEADEGLATIYAVSSNGKIITKSLKWSVLATDFSGDFTMSINTVKLESEYIAIKSTDVPKLTVEVSGGYSFNGDVVVKGYDGTKIDPDNDGNFLIKNNGTGTFTVTVSADVIKTDDDNAKAKHVVKSFTVYVVGSIVDADLDPAVESR